VPENLEMTLTVKPATILAPGENPTITFGGTPLNKTIQLGLPQGLQGEPGKDGDDGEPGPPGQSGVLSVNGIEPDASGNVQTHQVVLSKAAFDLIAEPDPRIIYFITND